MKKHMMYKRLITAIKVFTVFIFLMIFDVLQNPLIGQSDKWVAPSSADKMKNPYQGNEKATLAGKQLYDQMCAICHGKKGKGDGVAGMTLKPRPSNFTKDIVQKQTDGAIFWKLTEGKSPMAAYKEVLTEEQRWQLVNFIRSLD